MVPSLSRPAAGLRVRPALHARDRALPSEYPPLQDFGGRPLRRLLARGRDGGGGMTDARRCSRSRDLKKHYPMRGGVLRRTVGT